MIFDFHATRTMVHKDSLISKACIQAPQSDFYVMLGKGMRYATMHDTHAYFQQNDNEETKIFPGIIFPAVVTDTSLETNHSLAFRFRNRQDNLLLKLWDDVTRERVMVDKLGSDSLDRLLIQIDHAELHATTIFINPQLRGFVHQFLINSDIAIVESDSIPLRCVYATTAPDYSTYFTRGEFTIRELGDKQVMVMEPLSLICVNTNSVAHLILNNDLKDWR